MYYTENTIVYYNGRMQKATEAQVDLYMQTLHYGYGVFEGIRSYQTRYGPRIFKPKEHYERLIRSCELLHIPFEYTAEQMTHLTYDVLNCNGFTEAYIRPLVVCGPNMSLTNGHQSFLFIGAWEWKGYLGEKLLRLHSSSLCRPHPRSVKIEAKTCGHYVNSILAVMEAKQKGYDEALLLDHEGFLAEGPGANLFFEKDGKLFTPSKGHILPGITRATVIELCEELGIPCEEGRYLPDRLYNADSAFYCGTGAEIVGIESVDGKKLAKSWNQSLGKQVQEAYQYLVREQSLQSLSVA
ncbi:MAG TPA: branched-chain amino acid transaminase [Chitinophagaceae bacterium]|nr:branched-chain amino acid transaminase [Chitinophagaceae bacterium]